jgi:neutral ceramidase
MKNLFIRCSAVFLVVFSLSAKGGSITAGVSSIDITPPLEMKYTLGGYGERMNKPAEAIHDHIWAKALVVKHGDKKYAIITLDVLGLPANVKPDLIKRISNLGWTAENMMLLPSHSHGSLEMEALNRKNQLNNPQLGIFQPELLEFLVSKLETLVKEAEKNDLPVKIGTGSKILEGLNRNRRKDPEVDKEMTVTRIDLLNGKHLAVLVNWTAHPTFIGGKDMLVSAEWPGYLQKELQQRIGGGVTAMYYNGAEGDQSPVLNEGTSGYEKIQIYGEKIADMAIDIFNQIKTKEVNGFTSGYRVIRLPEHMAHPSFMKTGGEEYGLNENTVKIVMNMLAPTEVGIGAFKMGDFMIAGVPGEMTAVLGLNVKNTLKSRGIKYATIGGLANEWISYILSREQYLHGEGYESSVSFFGPGLGELISDEVIKTAGPLTSKK